MLKHSVGTAGAVVTGACCLGFAPVVGLLTAIGAGFLLRDAILVPLFVIFLAFSLWVLWRSGRRHGRPGPFRLGAASALVAFAALWISGVAAYLGLAGVVAASAWDLAVARAHATDTA